MCFLIIFLSVFATTIIFSNSPAAALKCTTRNGSCNAGESCLISFFAPGDSHVGECGYYDYSLCCDVMSAVLRGSPAGRVECAPSEEGVISLYDANDSHVEAYSNGDYNYSACVKPRVRCTKRVSCGENETAVFSIYNGSDSHVGDSGYYDDKICCLDQAPKIIELSTYHNYNGNNENTNYYNRSEVVIIRANITDTSGRDDIDTVLITIASPNGGIKVNRAAMKNTSAIDNGSVYEYNYTRTRFARLGVWNITVWANDSFGNFTEKKYWFNISKNSTESWVVNSMINVIFTPSGISNLELNDSELLEAGIDILTASAPNITVYPTIAKIDYAEGVFLKMYSTLSKIVVKSNHSFNPVLYLNSSFMNFYNGTANIFSGSGEQYNAIQNMTDIYSGTSGVAIIGRDLNISVYNTSYREIRLYNVTEFEIYVHSGNYTNAITEKDMYLNPPQSLIGLPSALKGISQEQLEELATLPYSEIKNRFGEGVDFNISVENTTESVGKPIPEDRDVVVVSYPMTIIGRLGNITSTYLNIALWLKGDNP